MDDFAESESKHGKLGFLFSYREASGLSPTGMDRLATSGSVFCPDVFHAVVGFLLVSIQNIEQKIRRF